MLPPLREDGTRGYHRVASEGRARSRSPRMRIPSISHPPATIWEDAFMDENGRDVHTIYRDAMEATSRLVGPPGQDIMVPSGYCPNLPSLPFPEVRQRRGECNAAFDIRRSRFQQRWIDEHPHP